MLFKPNFCCNCGERIERVDWTILTSRRFCSACSVEHKWHDRVPQAVVVGGVLALMFGLGSMFGNKEPTPPVQTLNYSPGLLRAEPSAAKPTEQISASVPASTPATVAPATPGVKQSPSAGLGTATKAHYCGALTKKGTPCSRKVKTVGIRCFQHEGKPVAVAGG